MDLNIGDQIPLRFQATDRNGALYVQAFVRDETDSEISGSPFALTHLTNGLGLYTNSSGIMPNNPFLTAQYIVYTDPGFTTIDTTYESELDLFGLNTDSGSGSGTIAFGGEGIAINDDDASFAEDDISESFAENDDENETI